MEDKRFQAGNLTAYEKPKRGWQEELYDDEGWEEMWRILLEIELLIELQETESRPFRF